MRACANAQRVTNAVAPYSGRLLLGQLRGGGLRGANLRELANPGVRVSICAAGATSRRTKHRASDGLGRNGAELFARAREERIHDRSKDATGELSRTQALARA